jgi:hypothetical protein
MPEQVKSKPSRASPTLLTLFALAQFEAFNPERSHVIAMLPQSEF